MSDGFAFFVFIVFAAIVLIGPLVAVGMWIDSGVCHAAWDHSGRAVQWTLWGGCQVQDHGFWIPADNVRVL